MNVAFTALHYGTDFLAWALRSVAPWVDRWVFAYAPQPSHGHGTDLDCPDTEGDLLDIVEANIGGTAFDWYRGDWRTEGEQRDFIYDVASDAGAIVVVDADEVWQPGAVPLAIWAAVTSGARACRVPFLHFWRGMDYYCQDAAMPTRVLVPSNPPGEGYLNAVPAVLHFGYAIRPEVMFYKWQIHGHLAEMTPERWAYWWPMYRDWTPERGQLTDLHPVNVDYWNARAALPGLVPPLLDDHPLRQGVPW